MHYAVLAGLRCFLVTLLWSYSTCSVAENNAVKHYATCPQWDKVTNLHDWLVISYEDQRRYPLLSLHGLCYPYKWPTLFFIKVISSQISPAKKFLNATFTSKITGNQMLALPHLCSHSLPFCHSYSAHSCPAMAINNLYHAMPIVVLSLASAWFYCSGHIWKHRQSHSCRHRNLLKPL